LRDEDDRDVRGLAVEVGGGCDDDVGAGVLESDLLIAGCGGSQPMMSEAPAAVPVRRVDSPN